MDDLLSFSNTSLRAPYRVCLQCGAKSEMQSEMKWALQEHPDGCGMATLATLCGMTYREVVAEMLADPWLADSEFVRNVPGSWWTKPGRSGDWEVTNVVMLNGEPLPLKMRSTTYTPAWIALTTGSMG